MKNFAILIIVLIAVACVNGFGFGGGSGGGGGGGAAPAGYAQTGNGAPTVQDWWSYQAYQRGPRGGPWRRRSVIYT
uniref:Uncharacterized protein n=1 Tax=Plectus sambesii TaxID=2011161 RepID=A0A914WMW3_9BILA